MKAYYVTVKRADKTGWLHGPHEAHERALELVMDVRREAENIDPRCVWDAFGTSSIECGYDCVDLFPLGRLNGYGELPL